MFSRDKNEDKSKKEKEEAKRSNSCETFKQIKEIFKNKSKGTLMTSHGTELKTEENLGLSTMTIREKSSLGGVSLRSVAETSFSNNFINKRLEGSTRVNNFIGNVKEQMKIHNKLAPNSQKTSSNISQQLGIIAKKHYLPYEMQMEKDVIIIHYKDSIKQLFYGGNAYILHRDRQPLYDMSGHVFNNPPKVQPATFRSSNTSSTIRCKSQR